jgi:putative ABC transport system permease protein
MKAWQDVLRRLAQIWRRSRFDHELEAEIQFHLEARADELIESGSAKDEARAQARREFGSRLRARESSHEAWRFAWFEDLRADVRYALRTFRRSPAFTVTAVASLALGIGASSAMFAALDAILWKPLPVSDPGSLVRLSLTRAASEETQQIPLEYVERLRGAGIFSDLILSSGDGLSFTYDDRAERIVAGVESPNFFSTLGLRPAVGRGFSPEAQNGRWAAEAVLSYRFWQRRFGGDPSVVGRTIHLNTYPFTIVGVSPESFFDLARGFDPELRIPLMPIGQTLSQIEQVSGAPTRRIAVTARVKASMTAASSEAAADRQLQEYLRFASPAMARQQYRHARLQTAEAGLVGDMAPFRAPMFVLLALVALVLIIACANVASMLLARGIARDRELALRASIGAGRTRLVRQLLAESVLLAAAGGLAGVGIAFWVADALVWFLPQGHISLVIDLRPDGRVLAFTSALSILAGIVFGLAPALQASRRDLTIGLKANGTGAVGSARTRGALVVAQVALSLVLLIVAGWFIRTVSNLRPLDFRAPTDRVLLFTMKPQREIYDADRMRQLVAELHRRMANVPGVRSTALAEFGPLGSRTDFVTYESQDASAVHGALDLVTPRFFETIGVALIAGRDFSEGDTRTAPPVVVINEALSQALFRGAPAVGRTLRVPGDPQKRTFTVIGVVANTRYYDLHTPPGPAAWIGLLQETPYMPTLHVRAATGDVASVVTAVRQEFDATDKGFPIFNIKTLEARVEDSLARERMVANISVTFGMLALLLAGVGLYGILAYSVSRRQREIGIRLALGSSGRAVLWGVAREAGLLVVAGAIAGIAIAVIAGRLAAPYLFGVSQFDVVVFLASAGALAVIALIAVSVPAARATRVNPMSALRTE